MPQTWLGDPRKDPETINESLLLEKYPYAGSARKKEVESALACIRVLLQEQQSCEETADEGYKMAERPIWEQIGTSFIQLYYQQFDTNREQLGALYTDASCLSWEGQQFQGKASIMEKLMRLPFQKIQHSITSQDHQPAPDNCILSMVVGQLKVDDDPVMGFHQLFVLKNINDKWICSNDIFRLALYNFA